jgi:hypothetical protein
MQFDDDEVYFQCPNCPATYNFTEFHKLEHTSHADPSEGANILGHATCRHCSKDFYYYLTSDAYPVVAKNDPPLEVLLSALDQSGGDEELLPPPLEAEHGGKVREDLKGNESNKMAQFEQAISKIDNKLPPLELTKRISEALDIIVAESPPKFEAAFDLLAQRFGLNSRKIEAFRKETNQKRDQIETDTKIKEINAIFAKLIQPPSEKRPTK